MTDKETKINFSPQTQTQKRSTQFRSRPMRSSSCTTKMHLNIKNINQKPENKNEKKKVILHVPRRKLKLQKKVDGDLLSMQQMKSTQNDLQFCNNEIQAGLYDQMYAYQCQFDSKATMKNNQMVQYHHSQHLQLKNMLIQLAENHQQMMFMLKQIINRQQKPGQKNDSPIKDLTQQGKKYRKSRDNYMANLNASRVNRKLKINRVFNQVINRQRDSNMSSTKQKINNSVITQDMKKSMRQDKLELLSSQIPSFVATMLVEVFSDQISYHRNLDTQNDLRELISRRFQAFNLNYNHFLEVLISLNCVIVHSDQLNKILRQIPFLLDEDQISLIYKTIIPKNASFESFKLSDLCQKMRCFIEDRHILTKTGLKLRINQMKSILASKKNEIVQAFNRISDENGHIELKSVQKVLKQFRLEDKQVQVLIAKLCVISKNVNQIKYSQIFDFNWLDNQAIIF